MKRILSLVVIFSLIISAQAQVYKYAVHFVDKANSPFSVDQPEGFLSQRSIDRRAKFNIPIIEEDLPINPTYIQDVLNTTPDAHLIIQVKWLNAIIISLSDTLNIELIAALPHVSEVKLVFIPDLKTSINNKLNVLIDEAEVYPPLNFVAEYDSAYYGGSWTQIHQLNGEKLHQLGYKGQGLQIAVLDAGFIGVEERLVFENLWNNDQILGTKNMVSPGTTVFADHSHGTMVLSTMGGYWEGNLIGTAPEADYWLVRTEDGATEFLIEEYNWVAGAAFADSVGADVINTSLGYTTFDDPLMNHTWEELNGDSTVITRGSNMAYRKGMLVVNSAGNSGNSDWRYVGAPADGYQVFSIGGVDGDAEIWSGSSHGFPWSDDVKPNVVARGRSAYVASASSDIVGPGTGTSFSSPILAGMAASLWSADPNLSPRMIKQAITYSANRFNEPDTLYGYGLPDFEQALSILSISEDLKVSRIQVSPNPVLDRFYLNLKEGSHTKFKMSIYNIHGALMEEREMIWTGSEINISMSDYSSGIYFVEVRQGAQISRVKISKQ